MNEKSNFVYELYKAIVKKIAHFRKLSLILLILIIGLPVWLIPDKIEIPFINKIYNQIFNSEFYHEIRPYVNYILGGCLNLYFNHISKGDIWNYGQEDYIYVRLEIPNNNRIDRINKLSKNLEDDIMQYKSNFRNLIAYIIDDENAVLKIEFDKFQAGKSFPYILKNYITAYTSQLGGVNSYVYGFGPSFSNFEGVSSSMFNVCVKGYNYEKVKSLAEEFRSKIITNPRIENVNIDKTEILWSREAYEIVGEINREKLKIYNITLEELFSRINKSVKEYNKNNVFRLNNNKIEYQLKSLYYQELQLEELENIILEDNDGKTFKVCDVINFQERKALPTINREDQQYIRYISFEFIGPYQYGKQLLQNAIANIDIPPVYSIKPIDFPIVYEVQNEFNIIKLFLAATLIIFMISSSFFESFKSSLVILFSIPFAFVGTIFLFWLFNLNIERGAYTGMLLIMGLNVNNTLIITYFISKSQKWKTIEDILALWENRLRAIIATSSATILALFPFIFNSDSVFWKNLSLSVIGGIFTSSIFIVFFLPVIFHIVGNYKN